VARVSVIDEGRGIAPEFLPRVFDRFSQQEGAPQAKLGLGLGLSIARHLVERQGGTITAHSDGPGLGAVFTFTLPVSKENVQDASKLRHAERHAVAP
jgi:signal transduction histidine kinase